MRLLVVHQNFPGQFGHLVRAWAQRKGWDVRALGGEGAPGLPGFGGLVRYKVARGGSPSQHPYLRQMEGATLRGQAAARAMLQLRQSGFTPDTILAHPGWGETLYAKDVFPAARLVHYCEWYYRAEGADLGFDPEFPISFDDRARIRTWNALHTLNLSQCDAAVSPTHWQARGHPEIFRSRITVQHEGIAIQELGSNPQAVVEMPNGAVLKVGDPVVTYVARNLEPYRGFHIFMRALEQVQKLHPHCHAIIIGADDVSYGKRPTGASNWREHMLREVDLDATRTHFLGRVSRARYLHALQVSACHVYLTYPFVLSWSCLEAMAVGCPIVASATPPVLEVLQPGEHGRLVDFFDVPAMARAMVETLEDRAGSLRMARRAADEVKAYSQGRGLEAYSRLIAGHPQALPERARLSKSSAPHHVEA